MKNKETHLKSGEYCGWCIANQFISAFFDLIEISKTI